MMNHGIKLAFLCIIIISESSASYPDRSRRSECVPTPPPVPGPFQAIVNNALKEKRAKGDCAAAKAFQQISNDICVGTVSRNPNFKINLNNPDPREFCQFLDITPLPSIMPIGPNTCKEIVECVASGIKGDRGRDVDIGKDCIEDVFKGSLKDMEKRMSDWTNTFTGAAKVTNEIVTSFIETIGCGKDPSKDASAAVRAIADMLRAMQNHKKEIKKNEMDVNLPKIFEMSPEEFFSGIVTTDPGEGGFLSILFGPKISFNWSEKNVNTKFGIFITVKVDEALKCKCFSKLKVEEIGLYESYGHGKTSVKLKKANVGLQKGFEILHGTSKTWSGYSFGYTVGVSAPLKPGVDGKVEVSMVFSATPSAQHNGRQILNKLIGFSVYMGVSLGKNQPPGITKGLSCSLAQVTSVDSCSPKPDPVSCPVNDLDGMRKRVHDTRKAIVQEWKSLVNTCRSHWRRKWKRCTKTADNMIRAWRGCARGFRRKCVRYDRNYCKPGKWIAASRKCIRYRWKVDGCRKWNTVRKCTQHGTKRHCIPQKYIRWARIPYPCGWKFWRIKWCHRNLARDAFRTVCRTVTNLAKCLKSVYRHTSCKVRKYVRDFRNCASWLRKAGRCAVPTVGHCSWFGSCVKDSAGSLQNMFRDCGYHMLPFVPRN